MTEKSILKIGAVVCENGKLLVVRKATSAGNGEYIMPGGRAEEGETHEQTLRRELQEELGVSIKDATYFGGFDDIAVFEHIPIRVEAYRVALEGTLTPQSEIKEYAWIDRNYALKGIRLGSILSHHVIPKLLNLGIM